MVIGVPYCKECGKELVGGAKFCPNCGAKAPTTKPMKEPLKEPQKKEIPASRKAVQWANSAILLYIVGGYFLFKSSAPHALGAFFLLLAFVFTGIAAKIHYRD